MATILVTMLLAIGLFVIAWAWVDGGRRPLHIIVETVRPQAPAGAPAGPAT